MKNPADFYGLDEKALSKVRGFGKQSAKKLLKAIEACHQTKHFCLPSHFGNRVWFSAFKACCGISLLWDDSGFWVKMTMVFPLDYGCK